MRFVVVQDYLRSGGTERQSVLLADAFAAAGHHSTLLTFRPGGALAPTVSRATHRSLQRIDMHVDWWAPGLSKALRELSPDAVLCMGRMANCLGGRIKRLVPQARVIGSLRTGKKLPSSYVRSLCAVDHVVANSREACERLTTHCGVDARRCSVIANSLVFRDSSLPVDRDGFRREKGAGTSTFVLLSVAMFRPEKNQRELIDIVSELPRTLDWQLWLAGDGPELAKCERRVEDLALGQRVKFLGWMRDPGPAYSSADLAVHASTSEALSNFLIESQAYGLPVVAYQAQGNRECMVPDHTGFIVAAGDREAFCRAILGLANETSEGHAARSQAARRFARLNFDPERQAKAYLDLVDRLVHE